MLGALRAVLHRALHGRYSALCRTALCTALCCRHACSPCTSSSHTARRPAPAPRRPPLRLPPCRPEPAAGAGAGRAVWGAGRAAGPAAARHHQEPDRVPGALGPPPAAVHPDLPGGWVGGWACGRCCACCRDGAEPLETGRQPAHGRRSGRRSGPCACAPPGAPLHALPPRLCPPSPRSSTPPTSWWRSAWAAPPPPPAPTSPSAPSWTARWPACGASPPRPGARSTTPPAPACDAAARRRAKAGWLARPPLVPPHDLPPWRSVILRTLDVGVNADGVVNMLHDYTAVRRQRGWGLPPPHPTQWRCRTPGQRLAALP